MKRILIADDEKNIRTTLKHALKNQYDVTFVESGKGALEEVKKESFDVILLDVNLGDMDGVDVLRAFKESDMEAAVIMMTAYGTVDKAVESMKLGAVDFLSKPFEIEDLRKLIEEVLRRDSLQEENLRTCEDWMSFAKRYFTEEQYDKVEEIVQKALGLFPEDPQPHNLLGVIYEMNNDLKNAQKHYRAALAIDPTYKPADHNLERTVMGFRGGQPDLGKN